MDQRRAALEYLERHSVMSLATSAGDGPAAAALFYASAGLELFFLSAPTSLHAMNLVAEARIAATIQDDVADWSRVRGLRLLGAAERVLGPAEERATDIYRQKFPGVFAGAGVPAALAESLRRVAWYRLAVREVRFIDNSIGFGHADEWTADEFLAGLESTAR